MVIPVLSAKRVTFVLGTMVALLPLGVHATDFVTFQTVIVTGNRLSFPGNTTFNPEPQSTPQFVTGGMGIGNAIASARDRALDMANVCKNPTLSAAAKQTAATTDMTNRWLTAMEVFNSIQTAKLWSMYGSATNGMSIVLNGIKYRGFMVTYSDGSTEKWAVTPNWSTSVVKLFDQPLPGSLTPPAGSGGGCTGKG